MQTTICKVEETKEAAALAFMDLGNACDGVH